MAKVLNPFGAIDARGSVGGITASQNTMGPYLRAKRSPVQPRTSAQQQRRYDFQKLVREYQDLSVTNIDKWMDFAKVWTRKDAFGNDIHHTGLDWYVSLNSRRMAMAHASNATPPLNPNTTFTPSMTVQQETVAAGDITVIYSPQPQAEEYIWLFWGGNQPKSSRYAKKDIRYRGVIYFGHTSPHIIIAYADLSPDDSLRQILLMPVDAEGRAGTRQRFTVFPVTFP